MDKITQSYRIAQISKVKNDWDYAPKVQLYGGYEGKTHCMDVSKEEWIKICQILTEA